MTSPRCRCPRPCGDSPSGPCWPPLTLVVPLAASSASAQDLTVYSSGKVAVAGSRQLPAYGPRVVDTVSRNVNGAAGGNSV